MDIGKMVKGILIYLAAAIKKAATAGKATGAAAGITAAVAGATGAAASCRATAVLAAAILSLAATSCDHKAICFMHPHAAPMRINVDWSDFVEKETPTGMTVVVYPQNGDAPVVTKSNTISHVLVNLPMGQYNSIVFNQSETEFGSLEFRNLNNYQNAEVATVQAPTKWYTTKDENERIVHEPEWFGTDKYENAEVTAQMIAQSTQDYVQNTHGSRSSTKGGIDLMHLKPQNIIHTIYVTVHIKNIYNLRSARAALEGIAEGYKLGAGKRSRNQVTHLLEGWSMTTDPQDPSQGNIKTKLLCFGLPDGHTATPPENIFNLSLLLVDNKTILDYKFEVGNLFVEDHEEHLTLHLEIDLGDPLPDVEPEGGEGGGFDASVNDWGEEIEHEVEL